jgi:hypothetical protein
MNQLKLRSYFIESFKGTFPPFLKQIQGEKVKGVFSVNLGLYKSKKNENNFAIKLNVKSISKNKSSHKLRIHFEATMLGFFIRLDKRTPVKILAKTIAKDMLYEKMYLIFSNVLNNSPLENFKIPLKLKQPR